MHCIQGAVLAGALLVTAASVYAAKQSIKEKRRTALDEYKLQCESRFSFPLCCLDRADSSNYSPSLLPLKHKSDRKKVQLKTATLQIRIHKPTVVPY